MTHPLPIQPSTSHVQLPHPPCHVTLLPHPHCFLSLCWYPSLLNFPSMMQLRKIAIAIKKSPTGLGRKWAAVLTEFKLPYRKMPRDVATRWNSTYDMLVFAVDHSGPIQRLVVDINNKLTDLQLSEEEWGYAKELRDALKVRYCFCCLKLYTQLSPQVFKKATLLFSKDSTTVTSVIPSMDRIDRILTANTTTEIYGPAIRAALSAGKRTLNRYYNKTTNNSNIYWIAMGKSLRSG